MLTLCSAGVYVVKPEAALGADSLGPVFEVSAARHGYYLSLFLWLALSLLEAVAGGFLVLSRRRGRLLGLVWAWTALGAFVSLALVNVLLVLPTLDQAGLESGELVRTLGVGPLAGCCPVVTALGLLVVLYHDSVARWAAGGPGPD